MSIPKITTALLAVKDQSAATRARMDRLTDEMASGRLADVGRAISSDFSALSRIEYDLRLHTTRSNVLSSAATWFDTAQAALVAIDGAGNRVTSQLTASLASGSTARLPELAAVATGALRDIGSALESNLGGRAVFANGQPMPSGVIDMAALLSETTAIANAATDVASFLAAFDDYFAPPPGGGVEANAIRAFTAVPAEFPIGGGKAVASPISVNDPEIRNSMKQVAMVAALPFVGFAMTAADIDQLAATLPARGLETATGLAVIGGRVGAIEERVEFQRASLTAERGRLEARRADFVAADPYETATRLQAEMTKLESIFAITARRARFKLTDYMR